MMNNFDFFVGTWTTRQRRLRTVLDDCEEWYSFDGVTRCWSVFDGAGNIDEVRFPERGFSGLTVRLYNAETDEWSLYWANSTTGLAMPPVVGRFHDDGRGIFTSPDVYNGRTIEVRYTWSDITPVSAHWEQAFSVDGGVTWETNWTADFRRTSDSLL